MTSELIAPALYHRDVDELQAADEAYEAAEAAFIAGVRVEVDRATLRALAEELARVSKAYNEIAYANFHAAGPDDRQDLDLLTERTEVLSELWSDLADAFVQDSAESH